MALMFIQNLELFNNKLTILEISFFYVYLLSPLSSKYHRISNDVQKDDWKSDRTRVNEVQKHRLNEANPGN